MLADFTSIDDAAQTVSAIIAAGILPAALEMMDQRDRWRSGGEHLRRRLSHATPRPCCSWKWTARPRDSMKTCAASIASAARTARATCASPPNPPRAPSCGRGARRPSARWDALRLTWWCRTPLCRAPNCRACWRASRTSARQTACRCATCFTPATATCTRTFRTTPTTATKRRACMWRCGRSCRPALTPAARSRASMGWASTSCPYMDALFTPDTLDGMCRLRDVFDPERRANPGKVVPVRYCRERRPTG